MGQDIEQAKKNIIAIGRLLWEKDLVSVLNGNISVRIDEERLLLTGTKRCLGLLQEKDILLVDMDGKVLDEGGVISTENLLHIQVYKNFPDMQAVIHTHTTYTNAFFLKNDTFSPSSVEAKFWFGKLDAVKQNTPNISDIKPVLEALRTNNIMVIKNHGIVAMGKDLFDCFLLVQSLEDAVKVDAISRLYGHIGGNAAVEEEEKVKKASAGARCYELFSEEQIEEIVRLVNEDIPMQELGKNTKMTMDLAVKLNETGKTYCFHFEDGNIKKVSHKEEAEFLISANESVWRAVFRQEIDPFVATTQKKMDLKGDFAKISKWYAPCSRIFELWQRVPVN